MHVIAEKGGKDGITRDIPKTQFRQNCREQTEHARRFSFPSMPLERKSFRQDIQDESPTRSRFTRRDSR